MRTLIGKEMKLDFSKSALREIAVSAEIRARILRDHARQNANDHSMNKDADEFALLAVAIRNIWS